MATFARLRDGWMLRGWSDASAAVADRTSAACLDLPPPAFHVARACDGETDLASPGFLPEHHAILDFFVEEGIAERCEPGATVEPWQRFRMAPNPFVRRVLWAVTGRCNLACRHCFMQSPSGRYGHLASRDALAVADQLAAANVLHVALTGGEPLLRRDLAQIIERLVRQGTSITDIFTNGALLTTEFIDDIVRIGCSPTFQISLDGVGFHDAMRGRAGTEDLAVNAMRLLRSAGCTVIVSTTVDRASVASLAATYELMCELGISAWRVGTPQRIGNWTSSDASLSLEQQERYFAPVLSRWRSDGRPFRLVLGQLFDEAEDECNVAPPRVYDRETLDCASCRQEPYLLPDGTLLPCPGYVDSALEDRMPNVLDRGFSAAWADRDTLLSALGDLRKGAILDRNPECRSCHLFDRCGGGCRASALRETGDVLQRDPVACRLMRGHHREALRTTTV